MKRQPESVYWRQTDSRLLRVDSAQPLPRDGTQARRIYRNAAMKESVVHESRHRRLALLTLQIVFPHDSLHHLIQCTLIKEMMSTVGNRKGLHKQIKLAHRANATKDTASAFSPVFTPVWSPDASSLRLTQVHSKLY